MMLEGSGGLEGSGRLEGARGLAPVHDERRTNPSVGITGSVTTRRRVENSVPPLFGELIRKSNGDRYVTISEGRVVEILPQSASGTDSIIEHSISNIWTGSLLTEHGPIATDGTVGVSFDVEESGNVNSVPVIAVRTSGNDKSVHYTPPTGSDTTGAVGTSYTALYKLVGSGDTERLESLHGASAVYHIHDTPIMFHEGGDASVFKKYDLAEQRYSVRGITGGTGITVTQNETDIDVALDGGGIDLNIVAYGRTITYTDGYVSGLGISTAPAYVIAIRGGIVVGHFDTIALMLDGLGETADTVARRNVLDDTTAGAP